jgi:hypothetical protein
MLVLPTARSWARSWLAAASWRCSAGPRQSKVCCTWQAGSRARLLQATAVSCRRLQHRWLIRYAGFVIVAAARLCRGACRCRATAPAGARVGHWQRRSAPAAAELRLGRHAHCPDHRLPHHQLGELRVLPGRQCSKAGVSDEGQGANRRPMGCEGCASMAGARPHACLCTELPTSLATACLTRAAPASKHPKPYAGPARPPRLHGSINPRHTEQPAPIHYQTPCSHPPRPASRHQAHGPHLRAVLRPMLSM